MQTDYLTRTKITYSLESHLSLITCSKKYYPFKGKNEISYTKEE